MDAPRLTGVLTGIVLILLAAVGGDFSLYMLCSCARRTGKVSYVEVARAAFGTPGAVVTTTVLMILTLFVMVAYMVLVRDIWGGLASFVVGRTLTSQQNNEVLFVALAMVFPLCLSKTLHALRHFCYVGFVSVIVLTAAIGYRSLEANAEHPEARLHMKLSANSWGDVFEAFPILCLSYLCHFNVLSVHSQFVNPTRERLWSLLHGSMGLSAALYVTLSLCGYLYAYGETKDDILLNFEPSDKVMFAGRIGMGLTMLVAITMMTLPCRDIMFTVFASIASSIKGCLGDKSKVYLPVESGGRTASASSFASFIEVVSHVAMTVAIMASCLYAALAVPGVGMVWSICGSSVGFIICYLLPAVFYLKIRSHKAFNMRKAGAWLIIVFSVLAIVICTRHAIMKIIQG